MSFSLSPAVVVNEIDLTTTVPAVATSIGALVGDFSWGPVNEIVTVDSEKRLVQTFGTPSETNFKSFFTASNFISYSKNLKVVRVIDETTDDLAVNASCEVDATKIGTATDSVEAGTSPTAVLIKNEDDYDVNIGTVAADVAFIAKYPGIYGNRIKVSAMSLDDGETTQVNFDAWDHADEFAYAPEANEFFVVVELDDVVVERFEVSRDISALDYTGSSKYCANVINRQSNYLWIVPDAICLQDDGVSASATYNGTLTTGYTVTPINFTTGTAGVVLEGGVDPVLANVSSLDPGDYQNGWDLFADAEANDINLCMQGQASIATAKYIIENICEARLDCVAFCSPDQDDVVGSSTPVTDIKEIRNSVAFNVSSSYAMFDGNYKYQYDRYNDTYRWLPFNGDVAGLCARTDSVRDPWWSPGGLNRGHIKNVVKLAFNPTKTNRDDLYVDGINPIVTFKGEGTVLWGDKTCQSKPSAFDRINVRRLFIVLEKAIATAAKYQLFEFNDRITRNNFVNMVEPFLRDIKGRRGIYDYLVVCDETNNTGEVIDRNEFVADIYVKPAKAINYIYLNFVAVKTGVAFEEVLLTNSNT